MDELSKILQVLEDFANNISQSISVIPGDDNNNDSQYDVDDLSYDGDYKTQVDPLCQEDELKPEDKIEDIREQEVEEEVPVEQEVEEEVPVEEVPAEEEVPGTETLPGIEDSEDDVPKDPETLGKIYELKKIYARLTSVESFLNDVSEPILLKLRNYVSESIELFNLMINNVDIFKDRMDDIIVLYYKFLRIVYELLRQFYEKEVEEDKKQNKKRGI